MKNVDRAERRNLRKEKKELEGKRVMIMQELCKNARFLQTKISIPNSWKVHFDLTNVSKLDQI